VTGIKCVRCGKYLSPIGAISLTEYSEVTEFEPREPIFMHKECYEKSDKEVIDRIAWIKPHTVEV